jgi:outer membrane protein assembly factor BamB
MYAACQSRLLSLCVTLGVCGLALPQLLCQEHDWPQWRGPDRTGVSSETKLLQRWPAEGPPLLWKIKTAGAGFSGPAIAEGYLFTLGNREGAEYVICFDIQKGRERWAIKNGVAYANDYGDGPRSTPTVDGDRVYALGASGDLCCLKTADGKEVWRLNILKEFRGSNIGWGISESPLVEEDKLIVTPGGEKGTIVALDKLTGRTIWTSTDPAGGREDAGYASPIAFTVGNLRQIATFTDKGGIGVRASDGRFLWRYDQMANTTANVATPIFHNDHIFFTSDYGAGCALLRLKADGSAEEAYFNKEMRNHHGGVVRIEGHLYGYSSSILTCMAFETGKVAWRDRAVGKGSLCAADGHLYLLSEDGVMALAEATPAGYKEKSRFNLTDRSQEPTWTHPVIANGRLYVRDQGSIFCYDVKQP